MLVCTCSLSLDEVLLLFWRSVLERMPKQTRKQQRPTRKQRGGRYIGEGSHGCGFRPALRCAGDATRRRGKFSKLLNQAAAEEEMGFRALLHPLDAHKQYFLYPDEMCEPAPFEASDEMHRCGVKFKGAARVILMSKGGDNLGELRLRPREFLPFFQSIRNIFHGLHILHGAGLAHMDVKPANIVCRRREDGSLQTRLIDFGLMVNPATLDAQVAQEQSVFRNHNVHLTNYMYWPFDVRLSHPVLLPEALAGTGIIQRHIDNFYAEAGKVRLSVPFNAILNDYLDTDTVAEIAEAYDSAPSRVVLYRSLFTSADIYGLGITLAQIYYRFTGHRDIGGVAPVIVMRNRPGRSFVHVNHLYPNADMDQAAVTWHQTLMAECSMRMYDLVRSMIQQDPRLRPELEEALARYEEILDALGPLMTVANIAHAIQPWMLDVHVLSEPTPVAGAAGGAGAPARVGSSSSERASPPAAAAAAAVVPLPNNAEEMPNHSGSAVSRSNSTRIPSSLAVSSTTNRSSSTKMNSTNASDSEERRQYENFINRMYNGNGW